MGFLEYVENSPLGRGRAEKVRGEECMYYARLYDVLLDERNHKSGLEQASTRERLESTRNKKVAVKVSEL